MRLAGFLVHEHRERHAPGALARDAPVGPRLDHAGDALLAPARDPLHAADRGERVAAQARFLHAQEPLRRRAEDHRRLVPPAMRIAVAVRLDDESAARPARASRRSSGSRRKRKVPRRAACPRRSARRSRPDCRSAGRSAGPSRSRRRRGRAPCARRRCRHRASRARRGSPAPRARRTGARGADPRAPGPWPCRARGAPSRRCACANDSSSASATTRRSAPPARSNSAST